MTGSELTGPLEHAAAEAVRNYIDGLRTARPARFSNLTAGAIQQRLAKIALELQTAPPMVQLRLIQERSDLEAQAAWHQRQTSFIENARAYSRRHGISYDTWRQVGVPDAVLRRAGIRP